MPTLWLIIWRFQPVHKGHIQLIESSLRENPETLILVGSSNTTDSRNPYSFERRKDFILWEFPESQITIQALPDFPEDSDWIEHILTHIPENTETCNLYCGDKNQDYAVQVLGNFQDILPFQLNIREIDRNILPISGTQIRENLKHNETQELKKSLWEKTFRAFTS